MNFARVSKSNLDELIDRLYKIVEGRMPYQKDMIEIAAYTKKQIESKNNMRDILLEFFLHKITYE
jgi:hypothetical protein